MCIYNGLSTNPSSVRICLFLRGDYNTKMDTSNLSKKEQYDLKRKQENSDTVAGSKRRNSNRRILLWGGVSILILVSVWMVSFLIRFDNKSEQTASLLTTTINNTDWTIGADNARVTLIEYADFQCPACAAYDPLVKKLTEEFKDDSFRLVYRHFPLRSIHQNANLAAWSAEAAGMQGKFWEMHDLIYENQSEWASQYSNAEETFVGYAKNLGLDIIKFESDLRSNEVKEKVDKSYKDAVSIGLNSTPSFFLNGKKIPNPRGYDEFKVVIEEALAR